MDTIVIMAVRCKARLVSVMSVHVLRPNKCAQSSNTCCIHVYSEDELFIGKPQGQIAQAGSAIGVYTCLANSS